MWLAVGGWFESSASAPQESHSISSYFREGCETVLRADVRQGQMRAPLWALKGWLVEMKVCNRASSSERPCFFSVPFCTIQVVMDW